MRGERIYPYLSLKELKIDPQLAWRLPQRLAYYHLVIPIAEEEDSITVAMMHPENETAVNIVRNVLNTPIVPVRSDPDDIKRALDTIWYDRHEGQPLHVLVWSPDAERAKWCSEQATLFADALGAAVTRLESTSSLTATLQMAREGQYNLLVTDLPNHDQLSALLNQSPTSMLLVRGAARPIRRILHILRGHAPDQNALSWLLPLAQQQNAGVNLLTSALSNQSAPISSLLTSSFADFLLPKTESGQHVLNCAAMLSEAGIEGHSIVRQGLPEQVIAAEINSDQYDWVAVAAEAYGDFVNRILAGVQWNQLVTTRAILIIKP